MTVLDDRVASPADAAPPASRGPTVWLAIGSIAAVVGVLFGALSIISALAHRTETFDSHFDAAQIRIVDISVDAGDVHVIGRSSTTAVDLHQRVTEGLFGTDHSARVVGDRLVVRAGCPALLSTHCAADVTASVPRDVQVIVTTNNGLNDVSGISGAASLTTDNGEIRGRDLTGRLSLSTDNGDISLAHLSSRHVSVDTDNGDVSLSFQVAPASLVTDADNGNVTVDLPADRASYALRTSTDHGDVSTPIRTDPSSHRRITASSDNGNITVRYGAES